MSSSRADSRSRSLTWRVLAVGLGSTVCLWLLGATYVLWRLGSDVEGTAARIERDVQTRFAERAETLAHTVEALRAQPTLVPALDTSPRDQRALFNAVDVVARQSGPDVAITVAAPNGLAVAWAGRPQAVPDTRHDRGAVLVLAPGALGLRLVYVEPVHVTTDGATRMIGSLAAEQLLSAGSPVDTQDALEARVDSALLSVTLTPRLIGGVAASPDAATITLHAPGGAPLADVVIPHAELRTLRETWWRRLFGLAEICLAITLLLLAGVLAWERRYLPRQDYRTFTALAYLVLVVARVLLWMGTTPLLEPADAATGTFDLLAWRYRSPFDLFATAFVLLAGVMLSADPLRRTRLAWRLTRREPAGAVGVRVRFAFAQLGGGLIVSVLSGGLAYLVQAIVSHAELDIRMLALWPAVGLNRLLVVLGLVALAVAVFWAGVLVLRAALRRWRLARLGLWLRLVWPLALWTAPLLVGTTVAAARGIDVPAFALVALVVSVGVAALFTNRGLAWFRRGTQGRRLLAVYAAILVPSLLLYPLLLHTVDHARRQLIATQYAPQVVSHPQELQRRLNAALRQIDAIQSLGERIAAVPREVGRIPTDTAFDLWRQTDLAAARLTSAVELYAQDGPQVSRFGFNFPEYQATLREWRSGVCAWDVFAEASLFGSEERSMLHAERAICEKGTDGRQYVRGGIILHVMLDYSSLPFLTTQGPYYDLFRGVGSDELRTARQSPRDTELVVYGWGRTPIFSSSERVWALPDRVFERAYQSRESFWDTQTRGARVYDLYVSNDRLAIYVVSVPRVTLVEHLIHVAEVATLAALALLLVLAVHAILNRVNRRGPQPATLLVREIRASFTRKLFLAFVATSVIPVLTLAFVVRTFVASRLRADVEAEATRTAAVARRVIEEAIALQQLGPVSATALSDDVMVWISRVIGQDVNIFDGPALLATSQRDLFAQGLLPERTPDTVYRAIALERLPTFVGEDQIGPLQYQLAATPIRVANREAILTVPMTLRQREIEREIAELDRSVNLGAVVFILLGAALGYSISGRIGDPVQRLTRASRRIAAGDLDQHIVAKTADELQGLVEAFNSMAADLSRQRVQLQRTHRLEAWAEMARQVAHDIKNPLTPIQLSAEHLRRVHADRESPLSPVLEQCVDTILLQVRMLRQISSEFASFASSPTARLASVPVQALVDEVLAGYRIGLPSNVRVQAEIDPGVPDVLIDRALLGRALINIIENALHAMPAGGVVTLHAMRQDEGFVRLALTDTGVGMDDEALARLFEPYFSTKAAGTGLGLSIARRNVELMGGGIDVRSAKGVGTTVSLDVPVAPVDPPLAG
ncbi:MAG: HAMP domain-containing protein [Acidobacteria bacterium]|nr:HAMP domain-containing protein [Acidobacteriota bacterium]